MSQAQDIPLQEAGKTTDCTQSSSTKPLPTLPLYHASFFSKLVFKWLDPILLQAYRVPLQPENLFELDDSRKCDAQTDTLLFNLSQRRSKVKQRKPGSAPWYKRAQWGIQAVAKYSSSSTVSERYHEYCSQWDNGTSFSQSGAVMLGFAILRSFPEVWMALPQKAVLDATTMAMPLVTKEIIKFSRREYTARHSGSADTPSHIGPGIAMAFGLFLLYILEVILDGQFTFAYQQNGLLVRGAISQAIYKVTIDSRRPQTTGKLITHLTRDAFQIIGLPRLVAYFAVTPITIVVAVTLLCLQIGVSGLVGIAVVVAGIPALSFLLAASYRIAQRFMVVTEQRSDLFAEILGGISTVKQLAWERPLLARLRKLRHKELDGIRNEAVVEAVYEALVECLPLLGSIVAFVMYSALHPRMDIANLFTAMTYFGLLYNPLTTLSGNFQMLVDGMNALERAATVFEAERHEPAVVEPGIGVRANASWKWHEGFAISADIQVSPGSFAVIAGPVGAGKSSILRGIVGEMPKVAGEVAVGGRVAYCPQEPWIRNASVRDNIVFGLPWEEKRYWNSVRGAKLVRDVELWPDGDMTEIGEKGINLSGGQKHRVSLARALYADAEVYLLDDPLSALDAEVGNDVFRTIAGLAKRGKAVVLVTHTRSVLSKADQVYWVNGGVVVKDHTGNDDSLEGGESTDMGTSASSSDDTRAGSPSNGATGADDTSPPGSVMPTVSPTPLVTPEIRITGAVGPKVYAAYLAAGNLWTLVPVLTTIVLMEAASLATTLWLVYWEGDRFHRLPAFYQGIYALLGTLSSVFNFAMVMVMTLWSITASKHIYAQATRSVLFSPMRLFDTTPLGRLQGVFSADLSTIDSTVPGAFRSLASLVAVLVGSTIIISLTFHYYIAIVGIVAVLYGAVALFYRPFAREVKRISSISRGVALSHFVESVGGLPTIRAFAVTDQFIEANARKTDDQTQATLLSFASSDWITLRQQLAGSLLVLGAALLCVTGRAPPGQVALVLYYAIQTTEVLGDLTRSATFLEVSMNAMERMLPYLKLTEEEAAPVLPTDPTDWPSQGAVAFNNATMAYRPGQPNVLKAVTLNIEPGDRVGVVGRTGAGKTSLTVALFRLAELCGGTITIDGISTATLGLATLRSAMAVISQTPALFSGTLRSNLDPFDERSDAELYEAMARSGLASRMGENAEVKGDVAWTLDMEIEDGGDNLSVGERSLVSLARAFVKQSKILVLDEATAAMDMETDVVIQRAIQTESTRNKTTVICIAHRLLTLVGWDKIAVMDAGEVVEYGPPLQLYDASGPFRMLCEEAGLTRDVWSK